MSLIGDDLSVELLKRRTERGWSLADLSARTGLSRAYLSALERGKSKRPGAETLRSLEGALGPLSGPTDSFSDAPPGLAQVAADFNLSKADVDTLAGLRVRGRQPKSRERWSFIYQAMLASEAMDDTPIVFDMARGSSPQGDSPTG